MTVEANSRSVLMETPAARKLANNEDSSVTPAIATATMAPSSTNLDDVFVSVKTTKHYHHSRLPAIIGTWFQFAKDQVRDELLPPKGGSIPFRRHIGIAPCRDSPRQ